MSDMGLVFDDREVRDEGSLGSGHLMVALQWYIGRSRSHTDGVGQGNMIVIGFFSIKCGDAGIPSAPSAVACEVCDSTAPCGRGWAFNEGMDSCHIHP